MPQRPTASSPRVITRETYALLIFACSLGDTLMNTVLVFAERMLPSTQTFIPLQVNELQRYTAQYVGLIPADRNLALPHEPILLTKERTRSARCRRETYRWLGVAPHFHNRLQQVGSQLIHAHFAEGASPALFMSNRLNLPLVLHLRGGAEMMPDERPAAASLPTAVPRLSSSGMAARLSLSLSSPTTFAKKPFALAFPKKK